MSLYPERIEGQRIVIEATASKKDVGEFIGSALVGKFAQLHLSPTSLQLHRISVRHNRNGDLPLLIDKVDLLDMVSKADRPDQLQMSYIMHPFIGTLKPTVSCEAGAIGIYFDPGESGRNLIVREGAALSGDVSPATWLLPPSGSIVLQTEDVPALNLKENDKGLFVMSAALSQTFDPTKFNSFLVAAQA